MKHTQRPVQLCEAEVTEGLEFVSERELRAQGAAVVEQHRGEIDFRYSGDLRALLDLKTVQSVSLIQAFAISRPRALLGNENFRLLVEQIETVRALSPRGTFQTFFIAAAGSDSSVMQRIKTQIAEATGLALADDKGDLAIRIRPGRAGEAQVHTGWETLVRLSPRPLVTRAWRVCNLEGALNAATAHAMVMLTRPQPNDVFLNLGCGSGTLLIERLAYGRCQTALGVDHDAANLACARTNVDASRFAESIQLQHADMTRLPLPDGSVSALCADLPFGQLSGTHQANQRLYPQVLDEATRVAQVDARFVLITHEVRLMESLIGQNQQWTLEQTIRVNLRGLHPRIYVLRRSGLPGEP